MKQTHVEVDTSFTTPSNRVELNSDGIGYVESYDFSRANLSKESRIACISTVASVCYQSPKALGSISLYDRLANESAGLPSSSFEFVPVLIRLDPAKEHTIREVFNIACGEHVHDYEDLACFKYGEKVEDCNYLLCNLRALIADVGDNADDYFNTEEECAIIAKHFKVFKSKVTLYTRSQAIRHRVSWQELSRRYVSGKKAGFEFYIEPRLAGLESYHDDYFMDGMSDYETEFTNSHDTEALIDMAVAHYNQAITSGVKPEVARGIIPQCCYTTVWSAWQPSALDSFFQLRLDKHAQTEVRELAQGMKELL